MPHVLLLKSPENRLNSIIKVFEDWGVRKEKEFHYLADRSEVFNFLRDLSVKISEDVLAFELSSEKIGLLLRENDDSEEFYAELVGVLKKLKTLIEKVELDQVLE